MQGLPTAPSSVNSRNAHQQTGKSRVVPQTGVCLSAPLSLYFGERLDAAGALLVVCDGGGAQKAASRGRIGAAAAAGWAPRINWVIRRAARGDKSVDESRRSPSRTSTS